MNSETIPLKKRINKKSVIIFLVVISIIAIISTISIIFLMGGSAVSGG